MLQVVSVYKFGCYMGVTRSRTIKSHRDYQKNKERVVWKRQKLHSTINKYEGESNINGNFENYIY